MRKMPPEATLVRADGATLDDLRESVATHEDAARTAGRVFGGAPAVTDPQGGIEQNMQHDHWRTMCKRGRPRNAAAVEQRAGAERRRRRRGAGAGSRPADSGPERASSRGRGAGRRRAGRRGALPPK